VPIRNKLLLGITLLLVIVVTLAASGFRGVYAYRGLVKSLRARADELPLATTLLQQVSDLRATAASARGEPWDTELSATPVGLSLIDGQFSLQFAQAQQTLRDYRARLLADEADERIGDTSKEVEVAAEIEASLDRIASLVSGSPWWIDEVKQGAIEAQLAQLQTLAAELPSHLHGRLAVLAGEVRTQYRSLIAMLGVTTVLAAIFLALFIRLFYRWVFQPLRVLVTGSRRVAAGDFNFRIKLASRDEIGELAESMNDMTSRFQAIRDDWTGKCSFARNRSYAANNWPASASWPRASPTKSTILWRALRCAPSRWKAGSRSFAARTWRGRHSCLPRQAARNACPTTRST
jgi:two-component system NtrC family sensor kinase